MLAFVLRRALPEVKPPSDMAYPRLLASVGELVREEPVLRARMLLGALSMASFTGMWTALSFLLASEYGYGEAKIGLFSLAGLAGAGIASFAGRAADRGRGVSALRVATALVLVSWGLIALNTLAALIVGVIVLDLGIQATQILNQSAIYRLRPEARSRLTTAYLTRLLRGCRVGLRGRLARVGARRLERGVRCRRRRGAARLCAQLSEIVSFSIFASSRGRSPGPVGRPSSLSTTSMPSVTWPKFVCLPSSHGVASSVTMKNCEPLVFGPALAIASEPRTSLWG